MKRIIDVDDELRSAVDSSLRARARVYHIRDLWRQHVRECVARRDQQYESIWRMDDSTERDTAINTVAQVAAAKDSRYRESVSDNQWFLQQASAYGTARLVEQTARLITVMESINEQNVTLQRQNHQIIAELRRFTGISGKEEEDNT